MKNKKFRLTMSADIYTKEGEYIMTYNGHGEGEAQTEYEAVARCAFQFKDEFERFLCFMTEQGAKPDNYSLHVGTVREVKE